jgi:ferredoxin
MNDGKCNLCRKCVGICRKTVGREAISYIDDDGNARVVFSQEKCIACGSCAFICDTGAITIEDIGDERIITTPSGEMRFKMQQCNRCGDYWAPRQQVEFMAQQANLPLDMFDICPDCRD